MPRYREKFEFTIEGIENNQDKFDAKANNIMSEAFRYLKDHSGYTIYYKAKKTNWGSDSPFSHSEEVNTHLPTEDKRYENIIRKLVDIQNTLDSIEDKQFKSQVLKIEIT